VIDIVCFSRNRPIQLQGYLQSLHDCVDDLDRVRLQVLVRAERDFESAYNQVQAEFPQVRFVRERDFQTDLRAMLGASQYTCFGCDDVVYVRDVSIQTILDAFREAEVLAFSLRLGLNVRRSMFHGDTRPPRTLARHDGLLRWDVHDAHGHPDWGYAFELNGTVYPTEVVERVMSETSPASPNRFEAAAAGTWSKTTRRRIMCAWSESRLVVPTVNVVQADFANPICGAVGLDPSFLLECWRKGLRLDVQRYRGRLYDSIHVKDFFLRRA
jgi:hypothetical protein